MHASGREAARSVLRQQSRPCSSQAGLAGAEGSREQDVLVDGHLFGPSLQVKLTGVSALLEPAAERMPQQLAPLREGHRHDLAETSRIDVWLGLSGLGIVALIPIAIRLWRGRAA